MKKVLESVTVGYQRQAKAALLDKKEPNLPVQEDKKEKPSKTTRRGKKNGR